MCQEFILGCLVGFLYNFMTISQVLQVILIRRKEESMTVLAGSNPIC